LGEGRVGGKGGGGGFANYFVVESFITLTLMVKVKGKI